MKKLFFLTSLVSLVYLSCKANKDAMKTDEKTPTLVSNTSNSPVTYRLIVTFISKGEGTDSKKRTAFLKYVETHPKKPAYKAIIWGREGEADYCLKLNEISSKKERIKFIAEIKKIVGKTDMVIISENAECEHKVR